MRPDGSPWMAEIAEAVRRKCARGGGLPPDERDAIAYIVTAIADGDGVPPQEVAAAELGMSSAGVFSRCVSRLGRDRGFVLVQRLGREPARYHVQWMQLAEWAGVDVRLAGTALDLRQEQIEQDSALVSHVSAATSSSSPSSSSSPPSPPTPIPSGPHLHLRKTIRELGRLYRVHVAPGIEYEVNGRLHRGITFEEFMDAGEEAARSNVSRKFDYMLRCVDNEHTPVEEHEESGVRDERDRFRRGAG